MPLSDELVSDLGDGKGKHTGFFFHLTLIPVPGARWPHFTRREIAPHLPRLTGHRRADPQAIICARPRVLCRSSA